MKRRLPVLTAVGVVAVGLVAPASAAWVALGNETASGSAATLPAPGTPVPGSVTTTSVPLSWAAAAALPTGTIGYHVQRRVGTGAWQDACGTTSSQPQVALSCTDSGLSAGTTYEYQVRSIFASWRAGSGTAQATTASVAAPGAPTLAPESDSGSSAIDRITRITTPAFTGTVSPGATVTLLANGLPVGTATASATGAYSVSVDTAKALTGSTSTAAHTVHEITVAQTVSGSTSAPSPATSITVDTAAPVVAITTSNTSGNGQRNPTFLGTLSTGTNDVRVVTVTISCTGTTTTWTPTVTVTGSTWSSTALGNNTLPDKATCTAVAVQLDAAGNGGRSSTVTWNT